MFQKDELGITINAIGLKTNVSYKSGHIIINPTQDKFVFIAETYDEESVHELEEIVIRFLQMATTPGVTSFGFNCELISEDTSKFVDNIDKLEDRIIYTTIGAEIINTTITQQIKYEEKTLNINEKLVNDCQVFFDINQHHDVTDYSKDIIVSGDIRSFINRCKTIATSFGFEIDGE